MRSIALLLTSIALAASACSGDDPTTSSGRTDDPTTTRGDGAVVVEVDDGEIVLTSALSGFDSCDALLDHLRAEGAERVGPYGFEEGGWWGPVAVDVARGGVDDGDDAAHGEGGAGATDLVEGVDFSGTNVQETGVDEADIIKTDGERVYVVSGGELVVVDVETRAVTGAIEVFAGGNAELFLDGDDVLHISQGWGGPEAFPMPLGGDAGAEFATDALVAPPFHGTNRTVITGISVSDGGTPKFESSLAVDGDYVSSRAVDGVARIVLRSNPQHRFPFVFPQGEAGEERAEGSNREVLLESELGDWLPGYARLDANGSVVDEGLLPGCDQVHAPSEFAGFGLLSVLTVPVAGDLDPAATSSVLAPGEVVYASTDSVYVATNNWLDPVILEDEQSWEQAWANRRTSLHRFDISSASAAAYTASGSVPGDIRNSFSLSEHEGHLRVVTTSGDAWDETSESFVRVLRESGDELVEVGTVGNLGNGEAVQSVRFTGDIAYVVTFRQVDPFYTVDLSDPENPRVLGELKIPGFSSYLHPIGDGLVIGVGSDATDDGLVTGAKVSVFDVSDLADPAEVAVWTAPDGWNDVGWDHRSFLWWGPERLAVVPVSVWSQGWSGAVVLRIDTEDGTITEVGRIDHLDPGQEPTLGGCDQWNPDQLPAGTDEGIIEEIGVLLGDGTRVALCDPGEDVDPTGFDCSDEPWIADEARAMGFEIPEDQRVVICWPHDPGADSIVRTMVLPAGELWSMSTAWTDLSGQADARLQVNDLAGLERLDVVQL